MALIGTTQRRVDATAFPDALAAQVAVMQYCGEVQSLPSGAFSLRQYGDGIYVLVDGTQWLKETA